MIDPQEYDPDERSGHFSYIIIINRRSQHQSPLFNHKHIIISHLVNRYIFQIIT